MRVIDLLIDLKARCHFKSKERPAPVTNSEMKRWCDNKSVILNGKTVKWDAQVEFPVTSLILFPKHPVTIA